MNRMESYVRNNVLLSWCIIILRGLLCRLRIIYVRLLFVEVSGVVWVG